MTKVLNTLVVHSVIALVDVNNDYQVADGSKLRNRSLLIAQNLGEGLNGFLGARYTINDNADDSFLVNAYVTYENRRMDLCS
jgi:hypothetical protein